jgi:hypothetical protein
MILQLASDFSIRSNTLWLIVLPRPRHLKHYPDGTDESESSRKAQRNPADDGSIRGNHQAKEDEGSDDQARKQCRNKRCIQLYIPLTCLPMVSIPVLLPGMFEEYQYGRSKASRCECEQEEEPADAEEQLYFCWTEMAILDWAVDDANDIVEGNGGSQG